MQLSSLNDLINARARTLQIVSSITQRQLDQKPKSNKWSPGEVADHLVRFDNFLLGKSFELVSSVRGGGTPVLEISWAEVDVAPACVPKSFMPLFVMPLSVASRFVPNQLRDSLVRNRLIPVQHPEFATPVYGRSQAELIADLTRTKDQWQALYSQNADLDFGRLKITHPLIGTNTLEELANFAAAHEFRHQGQISDAIATP